MKRNDVASFFYYMWNAWSEEECEIAFSNQIVGGGIYGTNGVCIVIVMGGLEPLKSFLRT